MIVDAYWSRTLARVWVHGGRLRLTYTSRDGSQTTWTGELRAIGADGPIIMWQGKPARLCPWGKLLAVEEAGP